MDPFTLHILAGHTDMNTTKSYIHPNEAHIREAMAKVWGGHSFGHSNEKGDLKAASDLSVTDSIDKDLTGATRRDRTGDLLITKFRVSAYAIDPVFGVCPCTLAISAWSARIEPDFEPNFPKLISRYWKGRFVASPV